MAWSPWFVANLCHKQGFSWRSHVQCSSSTKWCWVAGWNQTVSRSDQWSDDWAEYDSNNEDELGWSLIFFLNIFWMLFRPENRGALRTSFHVSDLFLDISPSSHKHECGNRILAALVCLTIRSFFDFYDYGRDTEDSVILVDFFHPWPNPHLGHPSAYNWVYIYIYSHRVHYRILI